jgi:hypothetical protein
MSADDLVRNRSARHRDRDHVAARSVDSLAHRLRHFVRLPGSKSDATLSVSNRDERVEGKATSALHDLGDAIDRDHVLDELAATITATTVAIAAFAFTTASAAALATLAARATAAALSAATTTAAAT